MSDLSSTENIGGVSVEIRGDLAPFTGDIAKAPLIAKAVKASVSVTADTTAMVAQIGTAVKNATQAITAIVPRLETNVFNRELATMQGAIVAFKAEASRPIPVTVRRTDALGGQASWSGQSFGTATWAGEGGNGGGTDGGSAGGGRGFSPYMNPFSNRGLARLVGNGAAVYGVAVAANLFGGLVEGERTQRNTGKFVREWDSVDNPHNIKSDGYLQEQATVLATAEGTKQMLASWEAVPVAGALIKMVSSITGFAASLEEETSIATKAAQSHMAVLHMGDSLRSAEAQMTFDPVAIAKNQKAEMLKPFLKAAAEITADEAQHSETKRVERDLRFDQLNQAAAQGDEEIRLATIRRDGMYGGIAKASKAIALRASAGDAMRGATPDAMQAMDLRHQAEMTELMVRHDGELAGKSPEAQKLLQLKQEEESNGLLGRQAAERETIEKNAGQRIAALKGEAVATGLRINKDGLAAELKEMSDASENRIAKMREEGRSLAEINQQRVTDSAHATEKVIQHGEQQWAKTTTMTASMGASSLRMQRDYFGATMSEFDAATKVAVVSADTAMKPVVAAERFMRRAEMGAAHAFDLDQKGAMLQARQDAAAILQGSGAPVAVLTEQAQIVMERARMKAELATTDPELRGQAKATMLAELKAQQTAMTQPTGAGYATTLRPGLDAIGYLPGTGGENIVPDEIAKSIAEIGADKAKMAIDPQLQAILAGGSAAMSFAGLSGFGALQQGGLGGGDGNGDATKLLEAIRKAVEAIATVAGGASGLGPVIGQ